MSGGGDEKKKSTSNLKLPLGAITRDANLLEKMTRWDRITKQHLHKVDVQTSQVKRLFGLNFVNERQRRNMNGDYGCGGDSLDVDDDDAVKETAAARPARASSGFLNPALVMDVRHSSIRSNKSPAASVAFNDDAAIKAYQQEQRRDHNSKVEQRYLDHELNKFKQSLTAKTKPATTASMVVKLDNYRHMSINNEEPENLCKFTAGAIAETGETMDECMADENVADNADDASVDLTFADANCYDDAELEVVDPFDGQLSGRPSTICFNKYVKVIDYETGSCADDSPQSIGCPDDDDDDDPEMFTKSKGPLRLDGKHLDCRVLSNDGQSANVLPPRIAEDEPSVRQSIHDPYAPIITVSKVDLESRNSAPRSAVDRRDPISSSSPFPPEQKHIVAELHESTEHWSAELAAASKQRDLELLRKHFRHWMHYVTVERIAALNGDNLKLNRNDSRAHKIEQYLRGIRHEKRVRVTPPSDETAAGASKVEDQQDPTTVKRRTEMSGFAAGVMVKKFSNKLKVQQDIIELQRLKLERQERMIAELKFNRLAESTRESQANCKQELREVMRTGCPRSKLTARCLQLVGNMRDPAEDGGVAEEYARLQARGTPKFLQDMQARALERNARHREARERRERQEREKEEQRLAAEAAKLLQDEQAKQQRIEELREKRRTERQQREQREQDRIRYLDNLHRANDFNRRRLLRRFGLDRFRALVRMRRENIRRADAFRVFSVLRRGFCGWRSYVLAVWQEKERRAEALAGRQLLRNAFAHWVKYQAVQHSKLLVAIDWHDMRLAERVLRNWDGWTRQQKCVESVKMRQAEAHYAWHLKWRVLDHWRRLRQILLLEKETDERRQRWRVKIWELLPDYQPNNAVDGVGGIETDVSGV